MLSKEQVKKICAGIKNARIGIIGDFCVDIYWHADMTKSELSRETPHYPLPIVGERVYLGAGGNVASNLAALSPKELIPISLIGGDWRGMLMEDIFEKSGMNRDFVIKVPGRFTNAYCKPMRKGISELEYEDTRLDFDNYEPISKETEDKVIENLRKISGNIDVLCVADQFRFGIITKRVRDEIIALAKSGLPVIADSRYNIGEYTDCILKPNEAIQLCPHRASCPVSGELRHDEDDQEGTEPGAKRTKRRQCKPKSESDGKPGEDNGDVVPADSERHGSVEHSDE